MKYHDEGVADSHDRQGISDFAIPVGADVLSRSEPLANWVEAADQEFQFFRCHEGKLGPHCRVTTFDGATYEGINLASQDYLGLTQDDRIRRASIDAILSLGTHSAGSEPMGGGLRIGKQLEQELCEFTQFPNAVLFPTGWAAGYGAIKALARADDQIVMDVLAHDCLQQGARASAAHVSYFPHNDVEAAAKRIARVRAKSPNAAVFVVTESLYSMDSDGPDLASLIQACREHGAYLIVDVAHDLGAMGQDGLGALANAEQRAGIDCIIGSFSKTFASIGGFVGTRSLGTELYVRGFSGTYTFSNFLMPPQIAAIREALRIVRSPDGEYLRNQTMENALILREALAVRGVEVYGTPSPMVITRTGDERKARRVYRECLRNGLVLNCIEYPACRRGEARLRLQVTPKHTTRQLADAADIISNAMAKLNCEMGSVSIATAAAARTA